MRKQEFNSKLISLLPLDEVPFTSTPSPPAPLAIRKAPSGRRRKSRRQSHKFFKHLLRLGTPTRRHALGRLPTPPPLPENLLLGLHRKLPSAPPASTTCKPHSSRGRGRPELGPSRLSDMGWAGILG